jgi:fibronectin type 3 domain-containing protein
VRTTPAHTRRLARWLSAWRAALVLGAVVLAGIHLGGSRAAVTNATIGEWSAPISWPTVAVHMSLTSTGKVFSLDGFDSAVDSETLWDPTTGTFLPIPYSRNLFCSGHIQLADGRTLLVGGHIAAYAGLKDTTIYNAQTNAYFRGADMAEARWYPTATQLPDGRVLAFGGDRIVLDRSGEPPALSDASVNSLPEVYNPTNNTWTSLTSAQLTSPLYPQMFVLSDGRILDAGPDTTTRVLTPGSWTWSAIGVSPFDGHSSVMYRPNKIMKAGSWSDPDFAGAAAFTTHGRTAVIDMSAASPQWRETAPMAFGRAYHNLTMLPDGTVLASGGGSRSDGVDISHAVLPAEIWNPDTETWTTVDSLTNGRLYHSTALLLPDGRVLMAGGGALPCCAQVNQTNAEIYSPPYLFKGARPAITSAPANVAYGSTFDVTTPDAAQVSKVSLIRFPSVTHAFDMNQRFQFLNFSTGSGKLTVQAPANANLAPPGDYMLFILDGNGVPSVASFVRFATAAGDTTPPTAPTGLSATAGSGQVALSWNAASDAGGILRYNVHRATTAGFTPSTANRIAQPSGTTYTDPGLASGTYFYKVTAEDNSGNVGAPSNEASATVTAPPPPTGLVGAWGFDEGSGTGAADKSGNNNNGTLSNATWSTTGKYGNALSFNGSNAFVSVPDSNSLDVTTGVTVEGWVRPSGLGAGFQTLLVKEQPGNLVFGLYANSDTNRPQSQVVTASGPKLLDGTAALPAGLWTHVAFTYDGTTQRLFVNGTQTASSAVSGAISTSTSPVKIGGNAIWPEWFNGLIDEVRIYDRALTAAQIQADMNAPITAADATPPSTPGSLSATGGLGQVSLSWGAATDNVGVASYNVHRSTSPGFTPAPANRIAQPSTTSFTDTGLTAGTPYYYKVAAVDAAGNVGPAGNEASATPTADTTPPTTPVNLTATAASGQVTLSWGASTDAGGIARYSVYRSTTSGFTPAPANLIGQPTTTSYADTAVVGGTTYFYKVTAEDNAGNASPASNQATANVPVGPPPGLVAAYGFDTGSGTAVVDQSGTGNNGTLTNATWAGAGAGKFGNALSFNGTNASVSVPDSSSLDLTSGMTIEGWVNPTTVSGFRTVILKERPNNLTYGLYSSSDSGRPQSEIVVGPSRIIVGPSSIPVNAWTHLAATFDGATQRLYVNGTLVGSLASSGTIATSSNMLKIGGNAIWGEWFSGLIDEVRIYNRALSAGEIQADMNVSITSPDGTPPSAPGTLTAAGTLTSAQLSWTAATDNVGVVRYNVYRSTTSGFTPSLANRVAQPTSTAYTDTVGSGTYYYRVAAEDAAGNIGPASNQASATVGDTTVPSAPGTLTATGGIGRATLAWGAATDNVGVTRYNVYRSTTAGFIPGPTNRIGQPTGTSYVDNTTPGIYFYKVTAEDAAGNAGPTSNEATATVTSDTSAPSAPTGLLGPVTGSTVNLSWTASSDNVGVVRYNVHRSTTSGFTPSSGNRIAQPTSTSYSDAGLASGTYYYRVTAEDAAGNISTASAELTASVGDATAPSAPGTLTASASGTTVSLQWTAASDNVGVVRYNVHRGTISGFTPSTANRVAQPTGLTYSDASLAPGTYFYKVTAEDAAGNVGPVSNTASGTVADTTSPTTPSGFTATGGAGQAALAWTASTDNVAVVRYNVHRSTVAGFVPATTNRIAQPTVTSYTDTGLAAGTYFYKVTAEDAAGNLSAPSAEAIATVTAAAPTGLVAAYGFDVGSGTTVPDQSGNGNNGALTNTAWAGAAAGKFGNALSFNGTNASVTVADSNSLDLTTGMTIEAWVNPTTVNDFRTVIVKERPGDLVYGLYAGSDSNRPQSQVTVGSPQLLDGTSGIPTGSWSHLAATFDGTTQRLFVNGAQVATRASAGSILTSTSAAKIGGNSIWGEWFSGLIDEVRIYSRALSATEIQADMNTSISSPDTVPPSAPGTLTATGGLGQIALSWGAATDNAAVARYNVHRSTSSGFTPSTANRVAQPTGTSYTDTGLAAGTYYYKVTAEDVAGNVGPAGNEASATATSDTTPPTVSITAPAGGATVAGTTTVTANASDNGSVAGVQFRVDGSNVGAEDTTAPYSVSWDTFSSANGPHTLSAVARDGAGNTTTSANVAVTVQNTASAGLNGAWAFDESSGTTAADQSGKGNNGTVSGATFVTGGKFNNALTFNGTSGMVTVADSATLDLTTGMTIEGWVRPSVTGGWRTAFVKEQPGNLVYGVYANNGSNHPAAEVYVNGATRSVEGSSALPTLTWSHLAATYDGATLRLYVNGTQAAQLAVSGSILTSNSPVRIGGNGIWPEFFNGMIDEVRIYNRALTASEIQNDMLRSITPDVTPPTITARTPTPGAAGVNAGTSPTVTFSEFMSSGTVNSTTVLLKDSSNATVPATVTYNTTTNVATLTPQAALQYGATYIVTVKGGAGGVTDYVGNPLAADSTWSFTVEASPPQVLVVGSTANPFGLYLGEILRAEGLNAFTTIDVAFVSPALLAQFDVVVLGNVTLTSAQVTALTGWVSNGGNLVAMRPDKQLAGLLGLTDVGTTLANAYLQVSTASGPGVGIVGSTIQFHGTADRYTLNGATSVATLYSNATTATTNPAVTLRSVGSSGGQAAAFTYDLARSVVNTRQGNPAWAGQERDGVSGIRPDDLFYGARAGDVQPDWIDTNKIAIPQADEQQRLLLNLITTMERDKLPLPRFWYLPRGEKAAVVMSGDDHSPTQAPGGTVANFDNFKSLSPPGCAVANWDCVRASSYVYPNSAITNAQATSYNNEGFEVALHPLVSSCPTAPITQSELAAIYDTQLTSFGAKYTGVPSPVSSRTHCVFWPDWASNAKVELGEGIRMDGNYYHYPGSWIGTKNGFITGGGFPMRFADLDGTLIDVYQANTNITDETTTAYQTAIDALLNNAVGPSGYYGAFGMNMHTDGPGAHAGATTIVQRAQAQSVPVISYKQLLTWTDGRNNSTIRGLSWSGGTLTFVTTVGAGANGLQTMLPTQGPAGTLSGLTCAGSPRAFTVQTIKGVSYALFDTITGTCLATYS